MRMKTPSPEQQLKFLIDLQQLLDEGEFNATYKYALLMAIADLCVEKGDSTDYSLPIALTDIAGKFIQYYWRQAIPYPGTRNQEVLYQNKGKQAAVINTVANLHPNYRHSLARARNDKRVWQRTIRTVARKIEGMPLYRLQIIAGKPYYFIYPHKLVDGQIILNPGVAFCFRQFHSMIIRMLQSAWAEEIRKLDKNQPILGQKKDLTEFLFGSERSSLSTYQPILMATQQGKCFYCQRTMRTNIAVDHFVPWSRYPIDLGHNFVLAHSSCNSSKADHLAAYPHLHRWIERNSLHGESMTKQFAASGLPHDIKTSQQIANWAYNQTTMSGGLTWFSKDSFRKLPTNWPDLFTLF